MSDNVFSKLKRFFSDKFWGETKLRRNSKNRASFISYINDDDCSSTGKSYISLPTDFRINEVNSEDFSLKFYLEDDCPFLTEGYGKVLLMDKMLLKKPTKKTLTVFLFENFLLLTTEQKKEDSYYYYASIKISNLSLAPLGNNKKKLVLKDFTHSRFRNNDIEYQLEAKTEEMQNTWRDIIHKCLWLQLLSAKDEQND